jgi:hypothetical protein
LSYASFYCWSFHGDFYYIVRKLWRQTYEICISAKVIPLVTKICEISETVFRRLKFAKKVQITTPSY